MSKMYVEKIFNAKLFSLKLINKLIKTLPTKSLLGLKLFKIFILYFYIAPEVTKGAKYSEAADVYSLGMTLCTVLLNHNPFQDQYDDIPSFYLVRNFLV